MRAKGHNILVAKELLGSENGIDPQQWEAFWPQWKALWINAGFVANTI